MSLRPGSICFYNSRHPVLTDKNHTHVNIGCEIISYLWGISCPRKNAGCVGRLGFSPGLVAC